MIFYFRNMKFLLFSIAVMLSGCNNAGQNPAPEKAVQKPEKEIHEKKKIITGAERTAHYLPLIKDKKVAIVANQTSLIGDAHLVDSLLERGVNITKIFCPEHGFRGIAGPGEIIDDDTDKKTGLPVISLYGNHKKPTAKDLQQVDMVIFDIQDVGVRFYTYVSTMHYVMEACAENDVTFLVLDRPNPNGFLVDGPVLDLKFKSFIGMHPVALAHGMTIAEYARMINDEKWLRDSVHCHLEYIPCENYTHDSLYILPVKPSPNLPNMTSVYLYPSMGLFEGTVVSVGRGTSAPFQCYGHPAYPDTTYSFTPKSMPGTGKYMKFKNRKCYGRNLEHLKITTFIEKKQISLQWLIDAYNKISTDRFFNTAFPKLAGTDKLQEQIIRGVSEEQIRESWQEELRTFKNIRKKYLLYPDTGETPEKQ